jgi:hypothetical protein
VLPFAFAAGLAAAAPAQQPTTFSIDWKSVTGRHARHRLRLPDHRRRPARPTPPAIALGPLPGPAIRFSAGFFPVPGLGLAGHAPCAGHPGSTPCIIEVDALSFGLDYAPIPGVVFANSVRFSCDEFAVGFPGFPFPPTVWTEGPVGDLATDVLVDLGIGALPSAPFAAMMPGSVAFLDGNGLMPPSAFVYPGLGLVEPRPPIPLLPAMGDNLDALETGMLPASGVPPMGFFYSLDALWPDPLTGIPNTGSRRRTGSTPRPCSTRPFPAECLRCTRRPALLGLDFSDRVATTSTRWRSPRTAWPATCRRCSPTTGRAAARTCCSSACGAARPWSACPTASSASRSSRVTSSPHRSRRRWAACRPSPAS